MNISRRFGGFPLGIRAKIVGSSLVSIGILSSIVVYETRTISSLSDKIDQLGRSDERSFYVVGLQERYASLSAALSGLLLSNSEDNKQELARTRTRMAEMLGDRPATQNEAAMQPVVALWSRFSGLVDGSSAVPALIARRDEIAEELVPLGAKISSTMLDLVTQADTGDIGRSIVMTINASFTRGRPIVEQALRTGDEDELFLATQQIASITNALQSLPIPGAPVTALPEIGTIRTAIGAYSAQLGHLQTTIEALNKARAEQIEVDAAMKAALGAIVQQQTEAMATIRAEAFGTARSATEVAVVSAGVAIVFSLTLAWILSGSISRPTRGMTQAVRALASGDVEVVVPSRGRRDEIGIIAEAVQTFKEALIRSRALEAETARARASAEEQRKAGMRQMADGFEHAVGGIVRLVSTSATQLQATAQRMSAAASETAGRSVTVAAAAEEAAANVNTTAAAAEEMGLSVQEIGRQVDGSADLARQAVAEAGQTGALVHELSQAVAHIGDVATMIASIAGQTNLLALNAAIEAARAGPAGRGFAVVAAEVKALAGQTAQATGEIAGQIARIQAVTGQAVSAIGAIGARIQEISGVSTSIAAAVDEQGAAMQEIVRNVSQAAQGTVEVTGTIAGVAAVAEETGEAADHVLGAAEDLSRQSAHLAAEVGRFLATVRAA